MNVMTLIRKHPLLGADLHNLGVANTTLNEVADTVTEQLGGSRDYNLCYVLSTLNSREFVRCIDVHALAKRARIPESLAQSIVLTIAPWVNQFKVDTFGNEALPRSISFTR